MQKCGNICKLLTHFFVFPFSIILTDLLLFRVGRDIIQATDFVRHYKHARFRHGRSLCASDFSRFGATHRFALIHDALYDTNAPNARFRIGNAHLSDATSTFSFFFITKNKQKHCAGATDLL